MKTKLTLVFALFLMASTAFGQAADFRISFDANLAGAACQPLGATEMYAHSGAGTSGETAIFEVVIGNWGLDDGVGQMTAGTDVDTWEIEFNLYDYYGLTEGVDVIYGIGVVFSNGDGSLEGKDDNCADIAIRGIETGPIVVENLDGTPFAGVTAERIGVGINTIQGVNNIRISPNPATDAAVFTFNSTRNANYDLTITNAMGQIVATQRVLGTQAVIQRDNLPAGLYFATLTDENGGRVTRRFLFN